MYVGWLENQIVYDVLLLLMLSQNSQFNTAT